MKIYNDSMLDASSAWVIVRLDAQIKNQPIDIYMVLDVSTDMLLAQEIAENELLPNQANELINNALEKTNNRLPSQILLTKSDPAELVLKNAAQAIGVVFKSVPAASLERFIAPIKQSFGQMMYSPSSMAYVDDNCNDSDREECKSMIPDSYDPCPCGSGKKYKFCCKKIFCEMIHAMTAAEDGNITEALKWIEKARVIVGTTAEILCREAIVYSFFDEAKGAELIEKCLALHPSHPRAHYIRGINLKDNGQVREAIIAYETAIKLYPASDHYHLNETYNNLGSAWYALGNLAQAKLAWETALLHLPTDKMAQRNLNECIYHGSYQWRES